MASMKRTKVPGSTKQEARTTTASTGETVQPYESVAKRAYEIWRESGCVHGNDQAHWFRAEQELRSHKTVR